MSQHNKFTQIIKQTTSGMLPLHIVEEIAPKIAESLIKEGAVLPPCKLGDTVWYISTENPFVAFEKELKPRKVGAHINGILITKDDIYISAENIDDVVDLCDKVNEDYAYLSEADAQAAINKLKDDKKE